MFSVQSVEEVVSGVNFFLMSSSKLDDFPRVPLSLQPFKKKKILFSLLTVVFKPRIHLNIDKAVV